MGDQLITHSKIYYFALSPKPLLLTRAAKLITAIEIKIKIAINLHFDKRHELRPKLWGRHDDVMSRIGTKTFD